MAGFVFVGPGRVGTGLALALSAAGYQVGGAVSRPNQSVTRSSNRFTELTHLPALQWMDARSLIEQADVVFLTVPDQAVTPVAQTLVDDGWLHRGQIVAHTSGAHSSALLQCVESVGAQKLSLHPLQTIADPAKAPLLFTGATFTAEGDEDAVTKAFEWVRALGGIPVRLRAEDKAKYHAAAVLASNAVLALMGVVDELAGLPNGWAAFLPLVEGALDNLRTLGPKEALTGPIERGDIVTVQKHLDVLRDNPTALLVYVALGRATVSLAAQKGSLSDAQRDALERLL
ncbi:Rossmann-like and DUF2520 domain-containing protein [Alicyclobacillus acidoterrestris]|uniref:Rossmann-like and DUF2520 domain-containing protein n=1 Tax=Alicyclobacillus acidoterrestris TaxID=1450 RepID=UPI003F52B01C